MGQDNAPEAGAKAKVRRSNDGGSLRKSNASDGKGRVTSKTKTNPKEAAAREDLIKSKLYSADKEEITATDEFTGYVKLKKIPESKLASGRDGDYSV